ncbi:hypothetical protein JTB14_011693 [Gonioctena quinquepunctata]|nr:hypothetical protein JTB14_011693 [Gonioctena quinquepunctata]
MLVTAMAISRGGTVTMLIMLLRRPMSLLSMAHMDIVLIKNLHWDINVTTLRELSSDHNPMKIEFGEDPPTQINRSYKVTNWRIFSQILENEYCAPENIPTPVELDAAVEQFENTIIRTLNSNFVQVPSANTSHNVLPRPIKEKIREKIEL